MLHVLQLSSLFECESLIYIAIFTINSLSFLWGKSYFPVGGNSNRSPAYSVICCFKPKCGVSNFLLSFAWPCESIKVFLFFLCNINLSWFPVFNKRLLCFTLVFYLEVETPKFYDEYIYAISNVLNFFPFFPSFSSQKVIYSLCPVKLLLRIPLLISMVTKWPESSGNLSRRSLFCLTLILTSSITISVLKTVML